MIGIIVKTWKRETGVHAGKYFYEVYVRSLNMILDIPEENIQRYIINKELAEDELEFYE